MADPRHSLFSDRPARVWTDAFPLGNGHLGAMVFGRPGTDRLQINDSGVWRGSPRGRSLPAGAAGHLAAARQAALEGDLAAAEEHTRLLQAGDAQMYQPFLDLEIVELADPSGTPVTTDPVTSRELDLRRALASTVHTRRDGERTEVRTAISAADDLLLEERRFSSPRDLRLTTTSLHAQEMRWTADGRLLGRLAVVAEIDPDVGGPVPGRAPESFEESVHAAWALEVRSDGVLATADEGVVDVRGATRLELRLTSQTQFALAGGLLHPDVESLEGAVLSRLEDASPRSFEDLLARAAAAHQDLYGRLELDLAPGADRGERRTTQDALVRAKSGEASEVEVADLIALLAHFGRYLLISGGRGENPPLTLQGIWNEDPTPPWNCDYTTNINLEMNYWPAGPANLVEIGDGLTGWAGLLAAQGAQVARELYGAPGWTLHHNSDRWGFAGPVGDGKDRPKWSFWPLGGAWVTSTLVDLHRFSAAGVPGPVRELLVDCCRFVLATLVEMPDGTLGTAPSTSPENLFRTADGAEHEVHVSTTSDLALIRDVLESLLELAPTDDPELSIGARAALERLPRERILPSGLIAEWSDPSFTDPEPLHRHQSHLIGLFPGTALDPLTDPARAEAARASLLARGFESTGWSLAWRICLAARLGDGELGERFVRRFLHPVDLEPVGKRFSSSDGGVYRTLLCAHPPFQIDGNFGALAGILELLLQSHRAAGADGGDEGTASDHPAPARRVDLLPALPPSWPTGTARGLRARDGVVIDLAWDEAEVRAVLRAEATRTAPLALQVHLGTSAQTLDLAPGAEATLTWPREVL